MYKSTQLGELCNKVEPNIRGSYKTYNAIVTTYAMNAIYFMHAIQNLFVLEWPYYGIISVNVDI